MSIRCAPFEALCRRKCRSSILWAEIRESSLTGLKLVQETTDKVVLVKEKPKVATDRQKSYDGVKLAPRYVGPFEILERIDLVAYRLRLPEELNSMHDTFHVLNLKKCLADANLHVPLDEIKVDKTLRFVEEPIEIMHREIRKLKRRKIALVKVRWNSERGLENWKLRIEHSAKSGGLLAGIHSLLSGKYCCPVRRVTCGYLRSELEGMRFGYVILRCCLVRRVTCEYLRSELEGKWNWIDPRAIEVVCLVFD
ncbi:hypothetical protein Tco_0045286 [Tanacetum coccineum]